MGVSSGRACGPCVDSDLKELGEFLDLNVKKGAGKGQVDEDGVSQVIEGLAAHAQ